MRFGELPSWAIELSDSIRDVVLSSYRDVLDPVELGSCNGLNEAFPFLPDLLSKDPLFDQLIVNLYHPGEVMKYTHTMWIYMTHKYMCVCVSIHFVPTHFSICM